MNGPERISAMIGIRGIIRKSWPLYLLFAAFIGMLAMAVTANAATMVPITACTDCHGTDPLTNAAPIESGTRNNPARAIIGSHGPHMNGVLTCSTCHVMPTAGSFSHRNGEINMAASIRGGTYSLGNQVPQDNQLTTTGFGTCNNTNCHGAASPAWAAAVTLNCTSCHGNPPATNAHPGHMSSAMTPNIQCTDCHAGAGAMLTATHPSGTVDSSCNLSACHNPTTWFTANAIGTTTNPSWTSGLNANCGWCHDDPPTTSALYSHSGVSAGVCTSCHGHSGSGAAHMDGAYAPPVLACDTCHGYPPVTSGTPGVGNNKHVGPTPVNHEKSGGTTTLLAQHGQCQLCHGTRELGVTNTHDPHSNYTVTVQHNTGSINMNSGTGYNQTNWGCDSAGCHPNNLAHQLSDSGMTVTFGNYGTGGTCTSCHTNLVTAGAASALSGGTVTTRRAIVSEFTTSPNWSHKRSDNRTVDVYDCIVCHMEGDKSTGGATGSHMNGRIDLRDPDTGTQIMMVSYSGTTAGTYASTAVTASFVRFSRNLGVTLQSDASWTIVAAVQLNHCLKCHDANGASSTLAQAPTATTGLRPFGVAITGHVAPFGSNGNGNVVNVYSSFSTTNAAYHPVRGKQNNSFVQGTRAVAPWNAAKTNGNTTSWGSLMSCWDCHAPNGISSSATLTMTVTAHGAPSQLRAPAYAGGTTAATNLCLNCHATGYTTSGSHGAGSAFTAGASNMNATTMQRCTYCHAWGGAIGGTMAYNMTSRPLRGENAHGFNDRTAGTVGSRWTSGARPYGFIRNTLSNWAPNTAVGDTLTNPRTCSGTGGTCDNNMNNSSLGVGGTY